MRTYWVNYFQKCQSVARIEARSEQEAYQVALETYPLNERYEFQGEERMLLDRSPAFVTSERPRDDLEAVTPEHTFIYHAEQRPQPVTFYVRQEQTFLDSAPVSARSPEEAIRSARELEEQNLKESEKRASETDDEFVDRIIASDPLGYSSLIYTSPVYVSVGSETVEWEESAFAEQE